MGRGLGGCLPGERRGALGHGADPRRRRRLDVDHAITLTGDLSMPMTFGMHLGHVGGPMAEMRKLWRYADANGFDWFSSADHFQESPYRDGNGPCFEAISTMTAIALDTKHVKVGSLVICVNYRNPGVLAKAVCTIDHLSGGRCELGIGAGWHQHEYEGFGIPFERIGIRQDHLEEAVQILRMLFDQPVSNFKGQYFQLNDARCNPKPIQKRLPIWVGGLGEKRTLRTAAKYADGWNAPYIDAQTWKAKNAVLDDWCAKEGRDPKQVARTVNVGFYMGADAKGVARFEAIQAFAETVLPAFGIKRPESSVRA